MIKISKKKNNRLLQLVVSKTAAITYYHEDFIIRVYFLALTILHE